MRRLIFATLLFVLACGSDSTGNGSPANVVIVSVSAGGAVTVQNNGGAGQYFVEWWGPSVQNPPGGGGSQLVRLAHTNPATIQAGGTATLGNPAAGSTVTKILAKTQAGSADYFTSSCYGSC